MANAQYSFAECVKILETFRANQDAGANVLLIVKDGENDLAPLTLLRYYQAERSLENSIALAQEMLLGKEVSFVLNEKEILNFVYGGGDLSMKFTKQPWLLDALFNFCYTIVLKKLTPPSDDSPKAEEK